MIKLFDKLFGWDKTFGIARSFRWSEIRKEYLRLHPTCQVCGKKGTILKPNCCHHIIPFHIDMSRELSMNNLIVLCPRDHFLFGHLCDFKSFNPKIKEDAADMLWKIKNRP